MKEIDYQAIRKLAKEYSMEITPIDSLMLHCLADLIWSDVVNVNNSTIRRKLLRDYRFVSNCALVLDEPIIAVGDDLSRGIQMSNL